MRWLALIVLVSSVAYAQPRRQQRGVGPSFPMVTADYKKLIDGKHVMFKQRLEGRMKDASIANDKREATRKKIATLHAELMKRIDELGADKSITAAEAQEIRRRIMRTRQAIFRDLGLQPPRRGGAVNDDDD